MRQPHLGVQQRGGGLGIGADLTGGRAQRVGRLERVPALGPFPACLAVADVDVELAHQGRARDLGLELVGRAGLDEAAPAVRTHIGKLGLVALGDRFRWRWSVAVGAVGVARLAAGRLRVGLGRALAERSGLTLAGAERVIELPGQLRDLGFEFGDTLEKFPATGTRGLVHGAIVGMREARFCARLRSGLRPGSSSTNGVTHSFGSARIVGSAERVVCRGTKFKYRICRCNSASTFS